MGKEKNEIKRNEVKRNAMNKCPQKTADEK